MSRDRGIRLQNALAAKLRAEGWPSAESAGSGRPGRDILGVPGVCFENKTADQFSPLAFVRQAVRNAGDGDLPVSVYWPRGVGEKSAEQALAIVPLGRFLELLKAAGYQ